MFSILRKWLESDELRIGISELSKMSQTSPRQLRYWEEKGYITSINPETSTHRSYRLQAVVMVEMIKYYLDQGFTLTKAAEKAQDRLTKVQHVRTVFSKFIKDSEVIADRFVLFTIGKFEAKNERLLIVHDLKEDTLDYHVIVGDAPIDYNAYCTKKLE